MTQKTKTKLFWGKKRMTTLFNVKDISSALTQANTLGSIIDLVRNKIDHNKFRVRSYHCLPPIGSDQTDPVSLIVCPDYPEEVMRDYKKRRLYRINPYVMKPILLARPLFWSEILDLPDLTFTDREFIKRAKDDFVGNGVSIPVFGPFGHNGVVSILFTPEAPAISSDDISHLQMVCQKGHLSICNLLQTKKENTLALTDREKEILEWLVQGKSNSVIADILGISIHTVDGHMRRIFLKFNTSDRVSAAVKAIAVGAIH
jgi:LuxR family transcriptional regulator/LuxR family quorum-sensing system transcriptional regulator CciR